MVHRLKSGVSGLLYNPNGRRAILILITLVIAAMVGGAPDDWGGG
jgi:hypothetical protein